MDSIIPYIQKTTGFFFIAQVFACFFLKSIVHVLPEHCSGHEKPPSNFELPKMLGKRYKLPNDDLP